MYMQYLKENDKFIYTIILQIIHQYYLCNKLYDSKF
jgi:hypothetical protein